MKKRTNEKINLNKEKKEERWVNRRTRETNREQMKMKR